MRRVIAGSSVLLMLCATVSWGKGGPPPARWWDDGPGPGAVQTASSPAHRQFPTVQIDEQISYIRYLFMHKQALILEQGGEFYFYCAYNDAQAHVTTKICAESELLNPAAWIEQDILEWGGPGTLRYISPTAYGDGGALGWYPQVTFNTYGPSATFYMYDEGGLGAGLWTGPMDVSGPVYDYYLPLTETGSGNVIYMDGQARDVADDSHIFKSFGGPDGGMIDPPGEVMIFPADVSWGPNPVYSQGYENSQLLYGDGRIVIATGGYHTDAYADPNNPLLVVYRESADGGLTWSANAWIDQAMVPDLPGAIPGIQGHYSNSFFDGMIESDGDLHFLCVVADSGWYENYSYIHGLYDLHQEAGVWTATQVSDGIYGAFNPRELLDGDSWMHSPSLARSPDGTLFAAWNDLAVVDWADTTVYIGIWMKYSFDGGTTWLPEVPIMVAGEIGIDEYYSRLVATTTPGNVYILSMPTGGSDGPLNLIQVPMEVVPVELAGFSGHVEGSAVILEWTTQSEKENFGFNVERAAAADGPFVRLNAEIIRGAGTTNTPQAYTYRDATAESGTTYWYRLEDVSLSGERRTHAPISVMVPVAELRLEAKGQPGVSGMTFELSLPGPGQASLRLYDLSGRLATELWEGEVSGEGRVTVNTAAIMGVTPGAYAAILTQGSARVQRTVVLLK